MRSSRGPTTGNGVRLLWLVGIVAALSTPLACIPRDVPRQTAAVPDPPPAPTFTLTALPVYRLVAVPALLDLPSRLLVVDVRLTTIGSEPLQFFSQDLTIDLPGGGRAAVFDPARANELLRRTQLAEADLGYLHRGDAPPGGIPARLRPQLAAMVRQHLLGTGTFVAGSALQGYVVVDTGTPLPDLDGAAVEAIARRVDDATPARYAYHFTRAAAAAEEQ